MNLTTDECKNLDNIKGIRNKICHWEESFSSIGWLYTWKDLHEIEKKTKSTINKYYKKVEIYFVEKHYLD